MKRQFLTDLGLEKDQVDKIMAEHSKDVQKANSEAETAKQEVEGLKNQLDEASKNLSEVKKTAGDNEELKKTIEELQNKSRENAKESQHKLATQRKNYKIDLALRDAGAKNVKAVLPFIDTDKVSVDDNGTLLGLNEQLDSVKESDGYLFKQDKKEAEKGQNKGVKVFPNGNPSNSNEKDPKSMSLEEQTQLYKSNPSKWKTIFSR